MAYSRGLGLCCLILTLLFFTACTDPEQKKQSHYNKALEFIQKDDSKSAVIELKNAIQIDPKFANARYQLALIHLKNGEMRDAFGQLKRAADLDPANVDAGVKVAEFLLLAKNSEESRKYTEQVLKNDPANIDALALLANIELVDGNFDAAMTALDKVPADKANTDRFYNIRGRVYAAQKDINASEEMFKKALEVAPDNIANHRTLLIFYQQQNRVDDAENILNKIATTFPENVQAHLLQANFYSATGKPDKAEQAALKALELDPKTESLYIMVAGFYKKQGNFSKAATFLENSLVKLPDSIEIKATLADYYFELKRFDDARATMEAVLATNPDHGGATFVKAKLLLNDNKVKEAVDLLTAITANYPKWGDPFYFLALARLRLGEIELASKAANEALKLAPADSRFHTLQAQIFLIQGESVSAGREATIALRLEPRNFAAAKLLAKALLQEKRFTEAVEMITKIREQAPTDIEMLGNLGLAHLGAKNNEEAQKAFSQLIELDPANSKALAFLASLTAQGDVKMAVNLVQKQIELAPEASGHYMLLGDLLLRDKQHETALDAFAKAQSLAPQNPQPYIIRARIMHALGKTDDAVKEFQDLLAKQPNSVPGHMGMATLLEIQKKYPEAKAEYLKVLELKPDQPAAANNLAYLITQDKNGDLGEALRLAMLAKQALPDDPHIADTLGMVHYKRDAYGLAISQFEQALINRPDDPIINYHLALAQFGNNDMASARAALEKSLASETAFAERAEAEELLKKVDGK
ncbi:tetratricopeptide repeat protein [Desulfopila aestuarii]|uniref:Flp pilus assembly protein TadD, contains TPR repeats n=1 Tax=Desulfopila aestuarii DSM 18488 TaxID=1121416 RepID=A0A1M7Y2J3_9BACT|nr:tetratricopeptide repeat protein [Desulfopila aestuarii]SHO46113.1 Flp pilus assembly protein TadD, contains TPR repeats [Desulfopila aestuarii DSM 18488]